MRSAFLRSTPLRLTVILGAAFLGALAVAGVVAFALIRQHLAARIDRSISDTYAVISRSYGQADLTDLIDSVASNATSTIRHDRVFALADASGRALAGNATIPPYASGLSTATASALGVTDNPDDYRILVGKVGDHTLLVGTSFAETSAVGWLTLTSLGWAGALLVAMVVAIGLIVAARAQRRFDGIADTMHRVGKGELHARIAISGRSDDIDMLATEMNGALDRLAALVEGMRQVSVDIAHDLKTPLNRLAITVESAIEAAEAGEPVAAQLAQAQEEGRQINATFDALLRIAQIESGARRSRFGALGMASILELIADAYEEVAKEHGQTLSLSVAPNLPVIGGDKDLLVQMFANLVENAIRHCPPGAAISVAAGREEGFVTVAVRDTGPGIPEAEREKVFRRLYRVEQSRTTPGSGLGLSLVKAIADLHGATIWLADNRPGLVVTVQFPLRGSASITNL